MFELSQQEYSFLRSQNDTLKQGAHAKYLPMALLNRCGHAIKRIKQCEVERSIQIIRIFTWIQQMLVNNTELRFEVEKIKEKQNLDALLAKKEEKPKAYIPVGFKLRRIVAARIGRKGE